MSVQKNNIGGIPKLSTGSLNVVSTISADALKGHDLTTSHPLPAKIDNAYGPGQTLTDPYTGFWFPPSEVIKIMKTVRFIVEWPIIDAYFVAFVGAVGTYTWGVHATHFDLDINVSCEGIFSAHSHTTGFAFAGLTTYGFEFDTVFSGSNSCATATGVSSDFISPQAFGPPIKYHDFVGPGGSIGADLEWNIIKNDWQGTPPITIFGFPPITLTLTGPNQGAGIDLYHWVGDIIVNGNVVASSTASYPPDTITIHRGYTKPIEVDVSEFGPNWTEVQLAVLNAITTRNSGIIQPYMDIFLLVNPLPFNLFPASFIPLVTDPWLGTCSIVIYILAQPCPLVNPPSLDQWITIAKSQKSVWAGRKVIIFIDTGYLYDNGCWLAPGLIPATIGIISSFCDSLADCGFSYGGQLDYKTANENEQMFVDLINGFFVDNPKSQPSGP